MKEKYSEEDLKYDMKRLISNIDAESNVKEKFKNFLNENAEIIRNTNAYDHLIVYFMPINIVNNKVLLVLHKGTGLWLFPGGHIELGNSLEDTIIEEAKEELGWDLNIEDYIKAPLTLTITKATIKSKKCRFHYDVWLPVIVDSSDNNITISESELGGYTWLSIDQALKLIECENTQYALKKLKEKYKLV